MPSLTSDKCCLDIILFPIIRAGGRLREANRRNKRRALARAGAGNGIAPALRDNFWDDLLCILDGYQAAEPLHAFARCLYPEDAPAAGAWADQAKGLLYEQGGSALLGPLRGRAAAAAAAAADELRQRVNYFADNEHRTDYPSYRAHGGDIGSGPTEAAGKVVGARRKGSGMRWREEGAAKVAPLRALHRSGPEAWDAFWGMTMAVGLSHPPL